MITPPFQWRRLAIRLAACVALGAVITCGIGWMLARQDPHGAHADWNFLDDPYFEPGWLWPPRTKPSSKYAAFPNVPGLSRTEMRSGSTLTERRVWAHPPVVFWMQGERKVGWPRPALRQRFQVSGLEGVPKETVVWSDGARPVVFDPIRHDCTNFTPICPLWPGFAADTAFYAAITLTLWSAPAAIRRHRRRARGHCPACGYNLTGAPTPTCPECGP